MWKFATKIGTNFICGFVIYKSVKIYDLVNFYNLIKSFSKAPTSNYRKMELRIEPRLQGNGVPQYQSTPFTFGMLQIIIRIFCNHCRGFKIRRYTFASPLGDVTSVCPSGVNFPLSGLQQQHPAKQEQCTSIKSARIIVLSASCLKIFCQSKIDNSIQNSKTLRVLTPSQPIYLPPTMNVTFYEAVFNVLILAKRCSKPSPQNEDVVMMTADNNKKHVL